MIQNLTINNAFAVDCSEIYFDQKESENRAKTLSIKLIPIYLI